MPSFKPKTNKKLIVDEIRSATLDSKHNNILKQFEITDNEIIPDLENKISSLKENLKNKKLSMEHKLDLKDEIKKLQKQINSHKNKKKNYYLNNSSLIFDYFENKKSIENNESNKKKILHNFFNTQSKNEEGEISNSKSQSNVKKYFINLDDSFLNINDYIYSENTCKYCKTGELIPVEDEGILVCNICHTNVPFIVESEKPSYKEPPKEVCFYAYKRINHFREILAQFQAKESTQIPEKVIEDIKHQIKKERIELIQLTNNKAKEILKKLGYNKYYEHIPFIKDMIGIKPPVMSPELEETLCNLFMEIQAPYAKFCPDDRVNFLNYYYTVYKLCELLDQKHFLPYFPMLKDREKRIEQDEIWKKICEELEWEFIPTL